LARVRDSDDISVVFYLLAEIAIFAAPLAAALLRPKFQAWPQRGRWILAGAAVFFIAGDALIIFGSWSLRGILADAVFVFTSYFAYCALIFAISTCKPRWLTYPLTFLGILPMALGLFLGTIGIFVILLVLGDVAPAREGRLTDGMSYRVRYYGGATVAHDKSVITIVRSPTLLPFLEEQTFSKDYIDTDCAVDLVSARLTPDPKSVEITCGRGVLDSVPYSK
jgi:hypothetical protein